MRSATAKRAFDLVGAGLGLLLCWPVLLFVALVVRLADGRPVFYRQVRIGRHGRPFRIWKFRTMVVDAERRGGPLTVGADARVTVAGRWLRRRRLDELPQLLNVLAGEMSLVGPRPEVECYVARYGPAERPVLALTPGITDPATLRFLDEAELLAQAPDPERLYLDVILPEKARLNLTYAATATVLSDLAVVLETLVRLAVPRRRGSPGGIMIRHSTTALALTAAITLAAVAALSLPAPLVAQRGATAADEVGSIDTTGAVLHPGDLVRIVVWRQPEMSGEFTIAADGSITHPLYRDVRVAGLAPARAEAELRAFLGRYEQNPQLVLEPLFRVSVGGEVRQPNLYSVSPGTTVQQAIAMAGGPTENGQLSKVQVIRDGRAMTVDLTGAANAGTRLTVGSGDQILVRRRSNVLRDVVGPVASLAAAAAAVVSVFAR